jgi:uncharacterized membrane protein YeiH
MVFAVIGSGFAIERNFSLTNVFICAWLTALGGGILRNIIFAGEWNLVSLFLFALVIFIISFSMFFYQIKL